MHFQSIITPDTQVNMPSEYCVERELKLIDHMIPYEENSDAPQSEKTSTTDEAGEESESKDPSTKKKEVVVTTEPTGEEMEGREVDAEEGQDEKETKEDEDDDGWFSWGTSPAAWGIQSGLTNVTNVVQKTVGVRWRLFLYCTVQCSSIEC